jgi:hypothetical protein
MNSSSGFQKDYAYGSRNETIVKPILESYFHCILNKTQKYGKDIHNFDFVSVSDDITTYYELKARKINHNKYNTALMEYHKVRFTRENPENKYILIFNYSDGLYMCDWDTIKDKDFTREENARPQWSYSDDEPSNVIDIPIEYLLKMDL